MLKKTAANAAILACAALLSVTAAGAHPGSHEAMRLVDLGHHLVSPWHLLAWLAGALGAAAVLYLTRRHRAKPQGKAHHERDAA